MGVGKKGVVEKRRVGEGVKEDVKKGGEGREEGWEGEREEGWGRERRRVGKGET